jgi:cytoskeletal protein CcmA (bactofilin family)
MPATPDPPKPPDPPARRFTDAPQASDTIIGARTRIVGQVTAEGPVDLGGHIEGDLRVGAHCRIRPGARVSGRLEARTLVVEGEVSGPGIVADKVEIGAAATVRASIKARVVAIADGALFEGEVQMTAAAATTPQTFTEKRTGG